MRVAGIVTARSGTEDQAAWQLEQLLVDPDAATKWVDLREPEPGQLPPPEPDVGRSKHERPVVLPNRARQRVVQELYDLAGTTANPGDDLFEQLRKGVTVVQALGFTPDLAVVSAADAETLDLSRSGGSTTDDGPFVLSPAPRDLASSPLWGLRVVVGVAAIDPIVMATRAV